MELDIISVLMIAFSFAVAGAVKGVIGLGLPSISLSLLILVFDLTTAMTLLLVPSLLTNLWQASVGGHFGQLIKRLWLFLLPAALMIWVGALVLSRVDLEWLTGLLGLLLVVYGGLGLSGFKAELSERNQTWLGPLCGIMNGVLTGMTGAFVVPGVLYLQSLNLGREQLLQAMGILFSLSTIALGLALQNAGFISLEWLGYSAVALVPAMVGMLAGQQIRHRLSASRFRQCFFVGLLSLGLYLIVTSQLAMVD